MDSKNKLKKTLKSNTAALWQTTIKCFENLNIGDFEFVYELDVGWVV